MEEAKKHRNLLQHNHNRASNSSLLNSKPSNIYNNNNSSRFQMPILTVQVLHNNPEISQNHIHKTLPVKVQMKNLRNHTLACFHPSWKVSRNILFLISPDNFPSNPLLRNSHILRISLLLIKLKHFKNQVKWLIQSTKNKTLSSLMIV